MVLICIFLITNGFWACFHVLVGPLCIFFCISVQMSSSRWMGIQIVVYSYNEKALIPKKTTDSCNNLDNSQNIMLSEDSQAQKTTYDMVPLVWNFRTGKPVKKESRLVVLIGMHEWFQNCLRKLFRVKEILYILIGVWLCGCKTYWTAYLKWVHDIVCKLYSNTIDSKIKSRYMLVPGMYFAGPVQGKTVGPLI